MAGTTSFLRQSRASGHLDLKIFISFQQLSHLVHPSILHYMHLERHLGIHLIMLVFAAPCPRQPEDREQNDHCRSLESRPPLLAHLGLLDTHCNSISILARRRGRRQEGRFGVHFNLLGGDGRLKYGRARRPRRAAWWFADLAYVMVWGLVQLVRIQQ